MRYMTIIIRETTFIRDNVTHIYDRSKISVTGIIVSDGFGVDLKRRYRQILNNLKIASKSIPLCAILQGQKNYKIFTLPFMERKIQHMIMKDVVVWFHDSGLLQPMVVKHLMVSMVEKRDMQQ